MTPRFRQIQSTLTTALLGWGAVALTFLSGCSTPPPSVQPAPPAPPAAPQADHVNTGKSRTSLARNSKEYRKDAAGHLYGMHAHRIYKGRMPPLLEAVGVLNVDIDKKGGVKAVHWMRAPRHAPHVMAEIERMVKASAPYPVPQHLSQVTYTDVWLWHKSGQFQLDTLTEGQD